MTDYSDTIFELVEYELSCNLQTLNCLAAISDEECKRDCGFGWFGPRGLASILFVLPIAEESEIAHYEQILTVVVTTVVLSIVLHGVTAGSAAVRYGKLTRQMGECAENQPVSCDPFTSGATTNPGQGQ